MSDGIRYGFKVGDRWPICKGCGKVFLIAYRKDEAGRWRGQDGHAFDPYEKCPGCSSEGLAEGFPYRRLAVIHYADHLGEVPAYTIRWAGNRYVMVKTTAKRIGRDTPRMHVFFAEVGGKTKEEALAQATRAASKNGLPLVLPQGFENVETP